MIETIEDANSEIIVLFEIYMPKSIVYTLRASLVIEICMMSERISSKINLISFELIHTMIFCFFFIMNKNICKRK